MHYRRLGKTGIKVSEISLGSWITFGDQIQEKIAVDIVHAAYEKGINFFDCADIYAGGKAETVLGNAIKGLARPTLVISSKVFWPTFEGVNGKGLSRKHILESIDLSLKRLQLDYVDLYFCHRYDPDTTIEEVRSDHGYAGAQREGTVLGNFGMESRAYRSSHRICQPHRIDRSGHGTARI